MTSWRDKLQLLAFGVANVPVIAFCGPRIVQVDDDCAIVRIPLNWRTQRRDIGAMYLGTLVVGADIVAGGIAFRHAKATGKKLSLVFKDMEAKYLKRADGDVHFTCRDGAAAKAAIDRALASPERQTVALRVVATVPSKHGDEPVAEFVLTLAIKAKP